MSESVSVIIADEGSGIIGESVTTAPSIVVKDDDLSYVAGAYNGPDEGRRRIAQIGTEIVALLLKKNADYGQSAWQPPLLAPEQAPDVGIRVRMSDKIQRLQRLLAGNTAEVNESIADSFRDLAGYAILWLARPEEHQEKANDQA